MISIEERNELAQLSRADGKRFYGVVEGIYKYLIVVNWVTGIAGGLLGLVCLMSGRGIFSFFAGIVVLVATAFACAANYAVAVLATHGAKILVHILFSNLAIMEAQQR
jgi:hypothetical protein